MYRLLLSVLRVACLLFIFGNDVDEIALSKTPKAQGQTCSILLEFRDTMDGRTSFDSYIPSPIVHLISGLNLTPSDHSLYSQPIRWTLNAAKTVFTFKSVSNTARDHSSLFISSLGSLLCPPNVLFSQIT